jgi:type VI secretion system protein ImpA
MDALAAPLDSAALLAPIPGPLATGIDPREDSSAGSLYFKLRDARSEARAAERQADAMLDDTVRSDWRPVRALAAELLATRAKDIEAACWLTEALLRTDGMAGLAAGIALLTGLVERYWDELHPPPDEEDGVGRRIVPVAGLNGLEGDGTLVQPLRKVTLFERRDGTPVAFWQYQQSAEVAGIADMAKRRQRFASGTMPFDEIEAEARAAAGEWAGPLRASGTAALQAWLALDRALAAHVGADAPPMGRVRGILEEITEIATRHAPAEAAPALPQPVMAAEPAQATDAGGTRNFSARDDALRTLIEISEFFRRTEPHSPLAYTLTEAVRRARLTWPELLEEIVPDHQNRSAILERLGIRPSSSAE